MVKFVPMVKFAPVIKRKFKSSKNQMKGLLESSKERKATKTQKRDGISKSRGLKSRVRAANDHSGLPGLPLKDKVGATSFGSECREGC
jgi:hypothetical protein